VRESTFEFASKIRAWVGRAQLAPLGSIRYSRRVSRPLRGLFVLLALLPLVACAPKRPPVEDSVPPWIKDMPVVPLEVMEYRATEAEGEHALFMRISRFPDRLSYAPVEEPPEVVIQMDGPAVGEDLPEERIVIPDALMPAVRVSRTAGALTVVIEVAAAEMPRYVVHEAADWVIVRMLPTPEWVPPSERRLQPPGPQR
jgi:hypothetical protein